jgi:hypothetical protein
VHSLTEDVAMDTASGSSKSRSPSSDPFALGLRAAAAAAEPLDAELESMRARLARALSAAPAPPAAEPGPSVGPPEDAIVAMNGLPFTDADAAQFKAARLRAETGEEFAVVAVADGFVVVPPRPVVGEPERVPRSRPEDVATPPTKPPERRKSVLDPEGLVLDDFPKDHPVHKYGLPGLKRYQRMLKKNYVLKQAYRSQLPLLVLAFVGALVAVVPDPFLGLVLPPESIEATARLIPAQHLSLGVSGMGALLALFSLGKIAWVRLFFRYRLLQNYAKSEAGIIARKTKKMVWQSVLTTDVHQTVIGRLLNFGSIELSCAGGDHADILIDNVYCPELIQALVEARVWEARHRIAMGVQS